MGKSLLYYRQLSLAFNPEYFSEFFIKFKDLGQFWNLLVMRITKLSLIVMINRELTGIFKVKSKSQFPKIQWTFPHRYLISVQWLNNSIETHCGTFMHVGGHKLLNACPFFVSWQYKKWKLPKDYLHREGSFEGCGQFFAPPPPPLNCP